MRLWQQLAIVTNWPILAAVGLLSSLGVVSIWVDNAAQGRKQLQFLAIATLCLFLFQTINYQRIGRWAWGFYILSLLLVIYTILPFTHAPRGDQRFLRVPELNGAFAWINVGPLRLQPAELTKISFVLVLARYLRFRSNYRTLGGLLPPFALALVPVGLILQQPDLGTAIIFIPTLFAMLFVAGAKMRHLLAIIALALALAPVAWLAGTDLPVFRHLPSVVKSYHRGRVYAMFSRDPAILQDKGFQQDRALMALGSGGTGGKGVGVIPVGQKVPEAHNDMIFALIGEQFGLVGTLAVLAAYMVIFAAGVEISSATREPFGKLVALGIVSLLATQTTVNLTVCLRLMPVTGVTLPFVSYGGSSLLASFIAAGLLLNVGQNRPLVMARNAFEFG